MTFEVKRSKCNGCGICASICAQTFEMGDDQKAHVLGETNKDNEECAITAMTDCPKKAITSNSGIYTWIPLNN